MLTGVKECQVPEIRSNLIRMVGILASLLVNNLNDVTSNVICTITEFILEQAHKENEVWVLAEAIDTLVDLYTEDETDLLAVKVKLVDKLAMLAPILRNKVSWYKMFQWRRSMSWHPGRLIYRAPPIKQQILNMT